MSTATTPGEPVAHRDRVRALLAYTVKSRLSRATPVC